MCYRDKRRYIQFYHLKFTVDLQLAKIADRTKSRVVYEPIYLEPVPLGLGEKLSVRAKFAQVEHDVVGRDLMF